MKLRVLAAAFLFSISAGAQDSPRAMSLTEKSNIAPENLLKSFHKDCPNVSITREAAKGNYTLEAIEKGNLEATAGGFYFTLFDPTGKILRSTNTMTLGGSVKDVCNAMKNGVIVEVVDAHTLTQSIDARGTGQGLGAVVAATIGRQTHTDTASIYVIVNSEHALLDCYERRKGCTTIGPGKYYGELISGSLWVDYEMPLTHQPIRNHYVIAGSW